MHKYIFTILVIVLTFYAPIKAQLTDSNTSFLAKEILRHINELRDNEAIDTLQFEEKMIAAAKNHSIYLSEKKVLTHNQENPDLETPYKRLIYHNCNQFGLVGENVLKTAPIQSKLNEQELKKLALDMFTAWKNSPGHYANMIHEYYTHTHFGFKYNEEEKVIYATNVFGKKGVRIKGQLSDDAYGINYTVDNCKIHLQNSDNLVANMGNAFQLSGNDIYFYYHNKQYIEEFLPANSALAIDLIKRDQFNCNEENQLDVSPIYDGVLLKPVSKQELLINNTAQNNYRLISKLGEIPETIAESQFSHALILIEKNSRCKYIVPGTIPSNRYRLRNIDPILLNPENTELKNENLLNSEEFTFEFKNNDTEISNKPEIGNKINRIHSVDIKSYSSVQGKLKRNIFLQENRANEIKNYLSKNINFDESQVTIEAKENWEEMEYQFRYYFQDHFIELTQDTIKKIIKTGNIEMPFDSLFNEQRKSTAIITYYEDNINPLDSIRHINLNLKTAIIRKDWNLANKVLYKIYTENLIDNYLILEDPLVYDALLTRMELVQNTSALLSIGIFEDSFVIKFLSKWIINIESLTISARNNILQLYALRNNSLVEIWDLPSKSLANIIHPNRIRNIENYDLSTDLRLNLNLTFINYFGQINDSKNTSKYFKIITDYFKERISDNKNEKDLVLFFNSWSRYDLTESYLLPKFFREELDEDLTFILLKTLVFYPQSYYNSVFQIHEKALSLNKQKWCNYINSQFQIMRDTKVKKMYCTSCLN